MTESWVPEAVKEIEKRTRKTRVPFHKWTLPVLAERLQGDPDPVEIRELFYIIRNQFLKANPTITDVSTGSKQHGQDFYNTWSNKIIKVCKQICENVLYIEPDTNWWIVRDAMNINAEGRAIHEGPGGTFIIDHTKRHRLGEKSSFILVCEKRTIGEELTQALNDLGYKFSFISSGGKDTADVKAGIKQIFASLEQENFFLLHLHDYDLSGLEMYVCLKRLYNKVIDVGVNEHFLKSIPNLDRNLIDEQVENKLFYSSLEHYRQDDCYDFSYLQGEEQGPKRWLAKRIELDAVKVEYGLDPFVNFIVGRLDDIACWDLTRIGIDKRELFEPKNYYEEHIDNHMKNLRKKYQDKNLELSENYRAVLKLVRKTIFTPPDLTALTEKHWVIDRDYAYFRRELKGEELDSLKQKYKTQTEKEWVDNFSGELDEEFNNKVTCWDGDVAFVRNTVDNLVDGIQERLTEAKLLDSDLGEFITEFDELDWGEDELDKMEPRDPVKEIETLITWLEEYQEELEAERIERERKERDE